MCDQHHRIPSEIGPVKGKDTRRQERNHSSDNGGQATPNPTCLLKRLQLAYVLSKKVTGSTMNLKHGQHGRGHMHLSARLGTGEHNNLIEGHLIYLPN